MRRSPSRPLVAGALVLVLSACGGTEDGPETLAWQAVRDTVGDTVVVRTVSGSVWRDTATLEAEVTIGELEGADEYIFGSVSALGVGPEGTIYVLDRQVPALRVYAPDGTYLDTWGREGEGPGEYEQPRALSVRSDARVLVRDPGAGRILVFGPDGRAEDTWTIRGSFSTSRPLYLDRDDNAYYTLLLDPEVGISEWRFGLVRITPDGAFADTLRPPTTDWEAPYVEASSENSVSRTSVPFSPRDEWHYSPLGYFVFGLSTRYALELHRPDQPVLRIEKEHEPVPVQPDEAAQRRDRITRNFRENFGTWRWNGPSIPDEKPPYRSFWVDHDGRIWVMVSQPAVEEQNPTYDPEEEGSTPTVWTEPPAFDLFDHRGRFLGHVRVPEGFSTYPMPVARGDRIWAVVRDEFDVQRVVRFRISRRDPGAATDD